MSLTRALSAVGLIRPTRRRGFCPACRLWANASSGEQHVELAPPALTVLASLLVAAIAWALVLRQSRAGGGMAMGPSSLESFSTSWVVMMAAMMLPSAMPLVFEFAGGSEGRRGWRAATGVLGLTYLSMWLAFGLVCSPTGAGSGPARCGCTSCSRSRSRTDGPMCPGGGTSGRGVGGTAGPEPADEPRGGHRSVPVCAARSGYQVHRRVRRGLCAEGIEVLRTPVRAPRGECLRGAMGRHCSA
jgi:predicted metal-binding integral membrane protein DUF2182